MKIASSRTREGLTLLLQDYFYTPSVKIDENNVVSNSKGVISSVKITEKKRRFIAEQTEV